MKSLINHTNHINQIIKTVSSETGISVEMLLSRSRRAPIVQARQISMWLSRWNSEASLQDIARLHGCTNHANVIHGCKQIEDRRSINLGFKEFTNHLKNNIKK
jgi:chromosomal replication initiator protein